MDRRLFLGSMLGLAGCGGSDAMEFPIQPTPTKKGGAINVPVPSYQEGSWTPNVGGNATYVFQRGFYWRIGNIVYLMCYLHVSTIGTGIANLIQGIPFSPDSSEQNRLGTFSVGEVINSATSVVFLSGNIEDGGIRIMGLTAAGASMGSIDVFQNDSRIHLAGMYKATA